MALIAKTREGIEAVGHPSKKLLPENRDGSHKRQFVSSIQASRFLNWLLGMPLKAATS
jgi:hypothetical protein